MGSPSVFHTAPPQPASNARITWSPVFAGGADASQKGFGLLMPAMSMLRSAMVTPCSSAAEQVPRGVAAFGDGVDDFLAAVDAVAAGEDLGVARRAGGGVGHDAAAGVEGDAGELLRRWSAAWTGRWRGRRGRTAARPRPPARWRRSQSRAPRRPVAQDGDRLAPAGTKMHAVLACRRPSRARSRSCPRRPRR